MSSVNTQQKKRFTLWRGLRLSSFHIGSAMGDILVTSIWNRILISNFGIAAAPVSFLIALRYLLAPLSLWAGHFSDTHRIFGLKRTPVIWTGRSLMILSLPLLGLSVNRLALSTTDTLGWSFALGSALLYGFGTLLSGSPFLALVRDSVPEPKQGLAISTVETVLIIFFAIFGIAFSFWMEVYDQQVFWQMIIATMVIGGFFWFFAIVGVEKRPISRGGNSVFDEHPVAAAIASKRKSVSLRKVLKRILDDRRTRLFFVFLALSMFAAWMQDAILEPFGADVFGLEVGRTTRLNSYWQVATVVTLIVSAVILRKKPPELQRPTTGWGLLTMAVGLVLLSAAAFWGQTRLIELSLLVFGAGFGFFTFGALNLMAVMSPDPNSGAYLGLWTIAILVFKGLGTFAGGTLRDLTFLVAGLPGGLAYGLIFFVEALLLVASVLVLRSIDIPGFAKDTGRRISVVDFQAAPAD